MPTTEQSPERIARTRITMGACPSGRPTKENFCHCASSGGEDGQDYFELTLRRLAEVLSAREDASYP